MRQVLISVALFCLAGTALAEDTQRVSFKIPDGNAKYIVSQNVEIGDVPNHIVRLFDTVAAIPKGAATVGGIQLVEVSARGTGDLIDGHGGSNAGYLIFTGENGDKFFSRSTLVSQRVSGKLLVTWGGAITGGTGKFTGIHGLVRQVSNFDPSPGGVLSNTSYDIEYSIGH
jgi:hypothetical protein